MKKPAKVIGIDGGISLLGKRILLADDNAVNRIVVKKFLMGQGAISTEVNNGNEALTALATSEYDLVLMDIEMPEMNGFEAVEAIRERGINTPVLGFTSLKHSSILRELKEKGFTDMVMKPFNPFELIIRMTYYISISLKMFENHYG